MIINNNVEKKKKQQHDQNNGINCPSVITRYTYISVPTVPIVFQRAQV